VRAGGARRTADRQRKREGRRTFPPTCAWNTLPLPSKRRADTTLAPRAIVTILLIASLSLTLLAGNPSRGQNSPLTAKSSLHTINHLT